MMSFATILPDAHNPHVQGALLALVPSLSAQENEQIIMHLLRHGDRDRQQRLRLYCLAAACLNLCASNTLASQTGSHIQKRLSRFIPPKTVKDADQLAADAGELAVQPLVDQLRTGVVNWVSEQSNVLRALVKIPGPVALQALRDSIALAHPLLTLAEGLKLWKIAVDPEGYAQAFLAPLFQKLGETSLRLYRINDLRGLEYLTTLEHLELEQCTHLEDLTPLAGLHNLKTLHMPGCQKVRDIAPLASLQALEVLNLNECSRIVSIAPLALLTRLREIHLDDCRALKDISGLVNKPGLEELKLKELLHLVSIGPCTGLPNLKRLVIEQVPKLKDISGLSELTGLEHLDICIYSYNCLKLTELNALTTLKQLRELNLSFSQSEMRDLSPLAALENIETMDVRFWEMDSKELFDVSKLQKVRSLYLRVGWNLTNLQTIGSLPQLEKLVLECSQLRSYSGIEQASRLRQITVMATQVNESIEPIASFGILPDLEFLYVSNLRSENLREVADLPHLKNLLIFASKDTRSLDGIRNLPVLDELLLSIGDSQIRDLRPLLQISSLREVQIYTPVDSLELSGVEELQAAGVQVNVTVEL